MEMVGYRHHLSDGARLGDGVIHLPGRKVAGVIGSRCKMDGGNSRRIPSPLTGEGQGEGDNQ